MLKKACRISLAVIILGSLSPRLPAYCVPVTVSGSGNCLEYCWLVAEGPDSCVYVCDKRGTGCGDLVLTT